MPGRRTPPMPESVSPQWAISVPARRMHHQPRRLVDDDQVLVLEDHLQRDVLPHRIGRPRRRDHQGDHVALGDLALAVAGDDAVEGDAALLDDLLQARPRDLAGEHGQRLVQALAGLLGPDMEGGPGARGSGFVRRI